MQTDDSGVDQAERIAGAEGLAEGSLQLGIADVAIMAPTTLIGTLELDDRLRPLARELRVENIEELPWNDSGVYLSRKRLAAAQPA